MTDAAASPTLHARLREIADDPSWDVLLRMEARLSPTLIEDGPAPDEDTIRAMLTQRMHARMNAKPTGRPLNREQLRARLDYWVRERAWPVDDNSPNG